MKAINVAKLELRKWNVTLNIAILIMKKWKYGNYDYVHKRSLPNDLSDKNL